MNYVLLPPAAEELFEAAAFHESRRTGFGHRFMDEFDSVMERILDNPSAWTPVSEHIRRCNFHVFPYGVLYTLKDNTVEVIAVMHLHQKPNFWTARLT